MSAWDLVMQDNGNSGEEVNFIKIPSGVTKLRIVDAEPKVMWKHWIQRANGGKGMSVVCIGKSCPICEDMKNAKARGAKSNYSATRSFAINAIQKDKDGVVTHGVLEKGVGLFKPIGVIREQMGDLINYDITITRTGEKMQDITYTVLPVYPPTPLGAEELTEVECNKYDLENVYNIYTREEIIKLMNGENIYNNAEDNTSVENTQIAPIDDVPPQGNIFTT